METSQEIIYASMYILCIYIYLFNKKSEKDYTPATRQNKAYILHRAYVNSGNAYGAEAHI